MQTADILSDPEKFPWRFDLNSRKVEFATMSREEIVQASFLDHRAPGESTPKSYAPLEVVLKSQVDAPKPRAPAYIFHIAFCSSTLISRCLDMPGRAVALKEPLILVSLASAKAYGDAGVQSRHSDTFKAVNSLLARPFVGDERVVIKPSNGANSLLPDVLAQPDAKVLLLYTDIRKFMLSVVKRGQVGRFFVRSLLHQPWGSDPRISGISKQNVMNLTDLQTAALIWQLQTDAFSRVLTKFPASQIRALNATDFEQNPTRALNAIDGFFDLNLGEDRIDSVVNGPLLRQDSKYTDQEFNVETRAQEGRDLEAMFGKDLDSVIAWANRQPFSSTKLMNSSLLGT